MNIEEAQTLYAENEMLVFGFLHKHFPNYAHNEDYQQDARLALWKACMAYVPDKNLKFSTLAYKVMENEILGKYRKVRKLISPSCSLDEPVKDGSGTIGNFVEDSKNIEHDTAVSLDLKAFLETLTENEKVMLQGCADGITETQIAWEMGTNQRTISKALQTIRRKYIRFERKEKQ